MTDAHPVSDLAEGFARHAQLWARELGAPEATLPLLGLAARRVSQATGEGHVCLDLAALAAEAGLDPAELAEGLRHSRVVGGPDAPCPLVLDGAGRLYLRRYYDYERRLARRLLAQARQAADLPDPQAVARRLDALFAHNRDTRPDWQKLAAALALGSGLTVISGGPGTGKTSTVVNILAALLEARPDTRAILAAPTGKAAARLLESLRRQAARLPAGLAERLPAQAYTLHRLLGVTPEPGRFRHHAGHPLALDVLVVDEASMLDLALATRLLEALPPGARLILLGDKDQLAAVEAGAVFAELSADPGLSEARRHTLARLTGIPADIIRPPATEPPSPFADSVVWFHVSHRFAADSGIGRLARLVNAGDGDATLDWLARGDPASLWLDDPGPELDSAARHHILAGYEAYFSRLGQAPGDVAGLFAAFDTFRVLGAVHAGPRGVTAVNDWLAQRCRQLTGAPAQAAMYPGRPVLIRRNDPLLGVYNGDVGLCLPDPDGHLQVHFPDGAGGYRPLAPSRLPEHDTAFAMTVHKAQGSEFPAVLLLLPDRPVPVLTRELLYTGLTRAARQVIIAAAPAVLRTACATPTRRHSGLLDRAREQDTSPHPVVG